MTRYQPALRPIISGNVATRPSFRRAPWRKHSDTCTHKLSRKTKLTSCRPFRPKARSLTSGINKLGYVDWGDTDRTNDPEENDHINVEQRSKGTQTDEPHPEGSALGESAVAAGLQEAPVFPDYLEKRHARRRHVLEKVEKYLEERCMSRQGLQNDRIRSSEQKNEMPPLLSETLQDPRLKRRGRFHEVQDEFYRSDETEDFSGDILHERSLREFSEIRAHGAVPLPPTKRGKLVTFYRNGDSFFRGFTTSVNEKDFRNYETLLEWLTEKMETPSGVRFVFNLQDGRLIRGVEEFKHGGCYVVAGLNKLDTSCTYGPKKQRVWSTQPITTDRIRTGDIHLFQGSTRNTLSRGTPTSRKPRILTIISNLDRSSREKLILNPQTSMPFEQLLSDLTSLIRVPRPPVKALFTERHPQTRVQSYSKLLREYKDHVNFIACGEEGKPTEMTKKRHAPGSNSSTESTSSRPLRKPRKFQKHISSASEATQSRTDLSIDDGSSHVDTPFPRSGKPLASIRQEKFKPGIGYKGTSKHETVRMSIRGRRKEFHPPSLVDPDDDGLKPDKLLKLDWIYSKLALMAITKLGYTAGVLQEISLRYGYRGKDARCNLYVIPSTSELLYFVGAVAVMYDRRRETQRHYCGHSEDITSMSLHPGKRLVASGQQAGKTPDVACHVRIWDTISLSTYSVIGLGVFQAAISCVTFSLQSQGDFVLVVDDGAKHTLSVWDWQNSKLAAKTTTTADMVVWGGFHNLDDTIIVTFGKRHIHFWRLVWTSRPDGDGRIVRDKGSGVFRDDIPKFVTSLAFSPLGDVVVGDSSGNITVWTRDDTDAFMINDACSDHTRNAHKKSVFSLCFLQDGTLLSGGGSEIKTWDSENYYRMIKERALPDTAGFIRTLVPVSESGADGPLCIGTTKNCILEGSLQHKFRFVIQGHSDTLGALAVHPKEPCFFTAGFDLQVCRWSTIMHNVVWKVQVEKPCVSMATDPSGKLLVVGTADGKLAVMSAGNGSNISSTQVCMDKICTVQFSPNGEWVAAGSEDGTVCLFEVMDDGSYLKKIGNLQGHKTSVTHMDWSSDNRFLQAVSVDFDICYYDAVDLSQVTSARRMRDVDWSTLTCMLSYNTMGPWTNLKSGEDIRCVCRSGFREYLVVGTNVGSLQLYKYPSSCHKAQCYSRKSFSSQTTRVQFTMEDRYIISVGGAEAVLMQWALKPVVS